MYERFTDRARKIMQLANEEAQRFDHPYIGTEHILLGLVKEGTGVAANVLQNLDVVLRDVRRQVETIVQAGPDKILSGKLPLTLQAKQLVQYAIEEARGLHHNYVGTEHLLLGLIRDHETVAAQVLHNLGLTLAIIRAELLAILGHNMQTTDAIALSIPLQSQDLSNRKLRASTLLQTVIDLIADMKEDSVSNKQFNLAAELRDKEGKLREIQQWLASQKNNET